MSEQIYIDGKAIEIDLEKTLEEADRKTDMTPEEYVTLEAEPSAEIIERGLKNLALKPERGRVVNRLKNAYGNDSGITVTVDDVLGREIISVMFSNTPRKPIHLSVIVGQTEHNVGVRVVRLDGDKLIEETLKV
ncbi:MAG: hypothetical protein AB7V46_02980 [Thermomicrobiales bacterium]